MRVVITGGFGFVGSMLAVELLRRGSFRGQRIDRLVLADRVVRADAVTEDARVHIVEGDLHDSLDELFAEPADAVIHLAAAVSGECEADLDLGLSANLEATHRLLDRCRQQHEQGGPVVTLVFSSSLAVYGGDVSCPLPDEVTESTLPMPQNSYGAQKFASEVLIRDYTRRGLVDGRVVRLMTVSVRPGKPNAAASSFLSGIVREPVAGVEAVCPVDPSMTVVLASPERTIEGILRVAEVERDVPGGLVGQLPVNLPGITVTVQEMLDTVREVCGDEVADRVEVRPDPVIERIVGSWPRAVSTERARSLGLEPDRDFAAVVRQHLDRVGAPGSAS